VTREARPNHKRTAVRAHDEYPKPKELSTATAFAPEGEAQASGVSTNLEPIATTVPEITQRSRNQNELLHVFIGPQKTATSWLFNLSGAPSQDKEILFPKRFTRDFIYRRYIKNARVLVWPYLIHRPERLDALLTTLAKHRREYRLYLTERDRESWLSSMQKFREKSGMSTDAAAAYALAEHKRVKKNIRALNGKEPTRLSIFDLDEKTAETIGEIFFISPSKVRERSEVKIYETQEKSRIRSRLIARSFFFVKPYMPSPFRSLTRSPLLRGLFFRSDRTDNDSG